jgi:hypothetical protein
MATHLPLLSLKNRSEQTVSRILSPSRVTPLRATIIHLGHQLPDTSCDLPGSSGGQPSDAPLFGLAPGGVCQASPVTRGTGALLPHRFTLTGPSPVGSIGRRRSALCCTFLHVTVTPRYGAPCPVVFGLSSGNVVPSDRLVYSGRSPHIGYLCHAVFFRNYPSKESYYRRGTISSCQNAAARCTSGGGYSYGNPCKLNCAQAPWLCHQGTFS